MALTFQPAKFIEEVKIRPGLYDPEHPMDRSERLELWKEVGAALFPDWDTYSKATAYDRVLQLQKKWRSFRDAYNRELRVRRADPSRTRKVYRYFKRMSFLGGFDGDVSATDAIQMEVVADVHQHQQQKQQQSQRNTQSTQTRPYSNAERQRRYREKRKAEKMNACTTFSQSSDVQPQQKQPKHDVQINKRQPQSNAERQRKYRKSLREQQQQQKQMKVINAITVLSNTPHTSSIDQLQNVDQAEHTRKRQLNEQRQRRFRARQRFESPSTYSHQAQEESYSDEEEDQKLLYPVHELKHKDDNANTIPEEETAPVKKMKRKKRKRQSSGSIQATEEYEMPMPMFSSDITENDCDSDRLFLVSFAPEMRQLPVHIKMWARAQIANIMQEAVNSHYNNAMPRSVAENGIKKQNHDVSSD